MELLSGKDAAAHVKGILHAQYQVHGSSVHLTARTVSSLESNGQIDFGGGEYVAAGRSPLTPQQLRLEDTYLWWDLNRGTFIVQCNETLHLAPDQIALIEPEDRLLRTGAWHVPLFVRGHIDPVEILMDVGVERLRVKENARIARVRIFSIDAISATSTKSRKSGSTQRIRIKKK